MGNPNEEVRSHLKKGKRSRSKVKRSPTSSAERNQKAEARGEGKPLRRERMMKSPAIR